MGLFFAGKLYRMTLLTISEYYRERYGRVVEVAGSLINTGQDCTAATRAIVARDLYDDFVAGVAEVMGKIVVGDPHDPDTDLGPLISYAHRDKVAAMVARAPEQGGRVVTGGVPRRDLRPGVDRAGVHRR